MIGADTSHCKAFTQMFHDEKHPAHQAGFRVVALYPSFSPDVKSSADRVDQYKKELNEKFGVKLVESIDALLEQVDVVMIESVDGRRHLPELRPVVKARKPVYIDKPFAASLADAKEMVRLLKEAKVPAFSTSSLRFDSAFVNFNKEKDKHGKVLGCDAFSPAHLEPTNPGLFWYGIHGVEILYTLMGTGCKKVECSSTEDGDVAVGTWKDNRLGTMRGIRKGAGGYGAWVLTEKGAPQMLTAKGDYYPGLVAAMAKFFKTGESPVALEETLEIMAFIDAALQSSKRHGDDVELGI
ncbi:MAG: Gfo/Idh/MocA family oxidoreductase [Phycisphaerae bacterium]|nr:Gfo/Idh/MocA family oxidoreductase [Phycisphaerae bacterium]